MTPPEPRTDRRMGRRSLLGLLGAVPVAAGGVWAASGLNWPADADESSGASGRTPAELRPGGELDRYIAQQAADDKFSGTFLLIHRDRPVLARSYGMADKARSVPNGPDTLFALGSITKLFTAVAVAQLAQSGAVAYHEKLGTYLDGFPAEIADAATIHQLLTHTSGMGDSIYDPNFWTEAATWVSAEQVFDGISEFARKTPLRFAPGTGHEYSNDAYHALGMIVAKVSGKSYYDYIREHIFRPAGMSGSDFHTKPQWRDDRRFAHPYTAQPSGQPTGQRAEAFDRHLFVGSPAGNSFSSAADLARFTQALLGNKLLTPAYTQLILTPKVAIPPPPPPPGVQPPPSFEAYAPLTTLVNNQWTAGHSGAAPGVATNLEWFPDSGWVVVDLCNYDDQSRRDIDSKARMLITRQ